MCKSTVGPQLFSFPRVLFKRHVRSFLSCNIRSNSLQMARNLSVDGGEIGRVFSTYTNAADSQSTVIIGAGVIGCATAYYLANSGNTKPDTIHLVEASPELFASASGKAGGFLTSDCTSSQCQSCS